MIAPARIWPGRSSMNLFATKLLVALILTGGLTGCSIFGKPSTPSAAVATLSSQSALAFQADTSFGGSLSDADRASLSNAERRALDYGKAGEEIGWNGKAEGVSGTIIASQPFRVGGSNCRRFEHKLTSINGPAKTNGTACQRDDGNWRLVR